LTARRTWFLWHSWIGLTAGLMLFVISWSGTVAVFSDELDWLLNPALHASLERWPMNWSAVRQHVENAFPTAKVFQIAKPLGAGFASEVILLYGDDFQFWRVYADPVSGQPGPTNLAAAQQIIDILSLLEQKTRGNLTAEERQLMEQLLYELRMRFIEASKTGSPEPPRIIIP